MVKEDYYLELENWGYEIEEDNIEEMTKKEILKAMSQEYITEDRCEINILDLQEKRSEEPTTDLSRKYEGKFKVTKYGKSITTGDFESELSSSDDERNYFVYAKIRTKKKAMKLKRECHKYDFGEKYTDPKNIKIDKDGEKYRLFHTQEGFANEIVCTPHSEGGVECVFRKPDKDRPKTYRGAFGPMDFGWVHFPPKTIIFEDIDTFFSCEFRTYDGNDNVIACRPKKRVIAGPKKFIKERF